jgi:PKD repeat protein
LPSFYAQAYGGAGMDSCDGSEELYLSASVSLDNDGDGRTDGADPDCPTNVPPTAEPNGPYNAVAGTAITFSSEGSSDADGTIVSFEWDFGDGSAGTGASPTHTYQGEGTFTVTLTVTDDGGAQGSGSTTATITPAPLPPTADTGGPYSGLVGTPISFDGRASGDADGTIVS